MSNLEAVISWSILSFLAGNLVSMVIFGCILPERLARMESDSNG